MEQQQYPFTLIFSKKSGAAFLSHLDTVRVIEKALRRTGLDLSFTAGFNQHIRFSCRNALPVGLATEGEPLTVWLARDYDPAEVAARLDRELPAGLRVVAVEHGKGRDRVESQERGNELVYEICYFGSEQAMSSAVEAWRAAAETAAGRAAAEEAAGRAAAETADCTSGERAFGFRTDVEVRPGRLFVRVGLNSEEPPRQSELLKAFRMIPEGVGGLTIGAITRVPASSWSPSSS